MFSEEIFHDWADVTREKFIEIANAEKLVEKWENNFGSYEEIRAGVFSKILYPQFVETLKQNQDVLDSTVNRYFVLEHLIKQGALDKSNIEGKVLDIGSFLGASVDALATYGGTVVGTDCGRFSYDSPSGKGIGRLDGRSALQGHHYRPDLTLVSCFNADWVENMSEENHTKLMCADAMKSLKPEGQILLTFSRDLKNNTELKEYLLSLPDAYLVELPKNITKRETYVVTSRNLVTI